MTTTCSSGNTASDIPGFSFRPVVDHQAPLSMGFPRQEYLSGLLCPLRGGLSDPGIESVSLMSPALTGGFFTTSTTGEAPSDMYIQH